jgi:hypothetical protein
MYIERCMHHLGFSLVPALKRGTVHGRRRKIGYQYFHDAVSGLQKLAELAGPRGLHSEGHDAQIWLTEL